MTVNSITAVSPNPRNTAVSSVDVAFSVPINATSLAAGAITLTDNGQPISTAGASLVLVSGTTYAISGLAPLTAAEGTYKLTVTPAPSRIRTATPAPGRSRPRG